MTVPLRVLGPRVLVRPDVNRNAPEQTEAGIYVATSLAAAVTGEDPTMSWHRGTVIAVGQPKHPLEDEAVSLADKVSTSASVALDDQVFHDAAQMLRDLVRRRSCVAINDDVIFSHDAGQEVTIDAETYLILHEDEVVAVIVPESASTPAPLAEPFAWRGHARSESQSEPVA